MQTAGSNDLKGAACAIGAVSIWASWSVITRLAVTTNLDASDIAALRFGVAGLLLAPVVVAAFLTACGTVVMRRAKLDPLHATALVSTGSLAIYLPIYLAWHGVRLTRVPLPELAAQAMFQGLS